MVKPLKHATPALLQFLVGVMCLQSLSLFSDPEHFTSPRYTGIPSDLLIVHASVY